jgi:hypothetical protein
VCFIAPVDGTCLSRQIDMQVHPCIGALSRIAGRASEEVWGHMGPRKSAYVCGPVAGAGTDLGTLLWSLLDCCVWLWAWAWAWTWLVWAWLWAWRRWWPFVPASGDESSLVCHVALATSHNNITHHTLRHTHHTTRPSHKQPRAA